LAVALHQADIAHKHTNAGVVVGVSDEHFLGKLLCSFAVKQVHEPRKWPWHKRKNEKN
jgi:hypothetical protein